MQSAFRQNPSLMYCKCCSSCSANLYQSQKIEHEKFDFVFLFSFLLPVHNQKPRGLCKHSRHYLTAVLLHILRSFKICILTAQSSIVSKEDVPDAPLKERKPKHLTYFSINRLHVMNISRNIPSQVMMVESVVETLH